ncbi:hypothetical protein TNIN_476041 [Trichonephila inaurata madagascariensis]|uniref:Uncharacterized protein n=1 Tax=Trichonephila inaurata madagascariensis TaxID=2747483 RepID=A0A8X6M6H6_9ARAC|nr:hypothetical protein TNIN_476041 [Trichonephila inaurata madagascariensis]
MKQSGVNHILCQNNSEWSSQPICVKTLCPCCKMESKENCSTKCIAEFCQVACKNGGNVIGKNIMRYLEGFQWTEQPLCACDEPNFPESRLLLDNCNFIPRM